MCLGAEYCTELGLDPANWSRHSPLPPPGWIAEQLDLFGEAVHRFADGDRQGCLAALSQTRSTQMREWYVEHGQVSGKHRARLLRLPNPPSVNTDQRDALRSPKKFEQQVFERDNFRCRYCGIRLVSPDVLKTLIKALNTKAFRRGPRNIDTHGIMCIFYPSADHVIPWNKGGLTNPNNLVTSCIPCNFGKDQFTIEQIGIEDPLRRQPLSGDWDGLLSLLKRIKAQMKA
jgi:5-methylcytosine-specific restriction endonuclease McrA